MAKGTVYQRKKMNTSDGSVKYYYVKVVNDKSVRISKETFDLATKRRSKKGGDPMAPVTVDVTNYKSGMFYGKSGWEILRDNHKDKPLIELLNANGITQNTFTPENIAKFESYSQYYLKSEDSNDISKRWFQIIYNSDPKTPTVTFNELSEERKASILKMNAMIIRNRNNDEWRSFWVDSH